MSRIGENHHGVTDAGLDFNYDIWTANTRVQLCNVPWNADYRDIVRFADRAALNTYLDDRTSADSVIERAHYLRQGEPIRLNVPFSRATMSNYIRVYNPATAFTYTTDKTYVNNVPDEFYYFIVGARHISSNTTELYVQLDVWQTYFDRLSPGRGYCERGHVGIANTASFTDYGRTHLTVPEGLDIGNDYVVQKTFSHQLANARDEGSSGHGLFVIVWSTTDLLAEAGTVDNPQLATAKGTDYYNLPNGASAYYFTSVDRFTSWMSTMSDKPWVTQGIMSVMLVPGWSAVVGGPREMSAGDTPSQAKRVMLGTVNWRDTILPPMFRHLKKFLTYPYTVLELTTHTGTPVILKPEMWQESGMTLVENPYYALPGPRWVVYPHRYGAGDGSQEVVDSDGHILRDGGEQLDVATGIFNFPTFSVVNNGYMAFLASNAHGIAFQHQTADWSQQKALRGNSVAYGQATNAMNTANTQTSIAMNQATQTTALTNQANMQRLGSSALQQIGGGAATGGIAGGVMGAAGAVGSGIDYAIGANQNNQQLAINNSAMAAQNRASVANMGYNRDTNKAYADYAAQGDYANQIAGINAKVQDAKLTQPSTSGQIGGDAFNLAMHYWGYDVKVKTLHPGAMKIIGDFWSRYGYAVNRFLTPPNDFHAMAKFTYWKFQEFYVQSSFMPENFKQSIRGIFEKGVTVWRNPNDIATVDIYNNDPIERVYY